MKTVDKGGLGKQHNAATVLILFSDSLKSAEIRPKIPFSALLASHCVFKKHAH